MIKRLLLSISGRLPCRIISDGDKPYLERYYLCTLFGIRFYLHRFVASDPDRGLHSHPWRWAFSIILSGWYWEHTHYGIDRVRWLNFLTGDSFHRVILPRRYPLSNMPDAELCQCWTIFFHKAKREKSWGFLRNKGQLGTIYTSHPSANDKWWKTAKPGRFTDGRQL